MKKLYVSADIEGVAGICAISEINPSMGGEYAPFAAQMTAEVAAACAGAFSSGIDEITVKDAHWGGRNIDQNKLYAPEGKTLQLIRGWSGHPFMMVQELDSSYHAAAFIAYHSAGSSGGNPLSHTFSGRSFHQVLLNDMVASELLLYAYAAATVQVPLVFLSGDKAICEEGQRLFPGIETVATTEGIGNSVRSILPSESIRLIGEGVQRALSRELPPVTVLPKDFSFRIKFSSPGTAYAKSFYPQVKQISDNELLLETKTYMDILAFVVYAANFSSS